MSRNMSIQAEHNKKLKKGATSQCLTSITKTEQHSIVLSLKPQNQLTVEKSLYPVTSVTQSTLPIAKTTGLLISNTPDSPKNTKEHLVLVKSNYPAEQFTDKKKYLCSSTSCSSPECIQTAIYITDAVNVSELSTLFGMKNTSQTNTRGKKSIYGSKQAMTHTTQIKQTLTSRSKTGYARRKNENPVTTQPVKTHQEQLQLNLWNSRYVINTVQTIYINYMIKIVWSVTTITNLL